MDIAYDEGGYQGVVGGTFSHTSIIYSLLVLV